MTTTRTTTIIKTTDNDDLKIQFNALNLLMRTRGDSFSKVGIHALLLAHIALSPTGKMSRLGAHAALRTWNLPDFDEAESVINEHFSGTDDGTVMSY